MYLKVAFNLLDWKITHLEQNKLDAVKLVLSFLLFKGKELYEFVKFQGVGKEVKNFPLPCRHLVPTPVQLGLFMVLSANSHLSVICV